MCGELVAEAHDVGMGHGAYGGNVVGAGGKHVGGSACAANVCGAGGFHCCICTVAAAGAKFAEGTVAAGEGDPGSFGCHHCLVAETVEEKGLNELGFGKWSGDPQDGFVGKDNLAFGAGPYVSDEA